MLNVSENWLLAYSDGPIIHMLLFSDSFFGRRFVKFMLQVCDSHG